MWQLCMHTYLLLRAKSPFICLYHGLSAKQLCKKIHTLTDPLLPVEYDHWYFNFIDILFNIWTHQARRYNSLCWKYKTVTNQCRKSHNLQACLWKVCSNHCGDCEGYCFQQVDVKWTEIWAQALLQFLFPPSSSLPHSVIRADCMNLALVMKASEVWGKNLRETHNPSSHCSLTQDN
jgi:hypothetical protein